MAQTVKQLCEHLIKQYGEDAMILRWNVRYEIIRTVPDTPKLTEHWLTTALSRVRAGEPEADVMRDYGYAALSRPVDSMERVKAECEKHAGINMCDDCKLDGLCPIHHSKWHCPADWDISAIRARLSDSPPKGDTNE